jgi:DNA topoisomerase VI subunit A
VPTEQVAESATPGVVPTEVTSDADRRAIYNANAPRGSAARIAVPDATPNVMRLGEQASDINRVKRPETLNTNDANNTTTETRLQRIDQAVADPQRLP